MKWPAKAKERGGSEHAGAGAIPDRRTGKERRSSAGSGSTVARGEQASGRERIAARLACRIRLVVLDVDGVLTDAGVYIGATSEGTPIEMKRFDIQDGLGIKFLRAANIHVALLSGRASEATAIRSAELDIEDCIQVPGANKLPALRELIERLDIGWDEVAMVGDDLPDLPVLRRVGLPIAVGNATQEVRREAVFTTRREGGRGAVREFVRVLLEARGEWDQQVEAYCAARSDD